MNLSKNFTYRTMTAAALAMGLSLPLYAAETTTTYTTTDGDNVATQTTKVMTTTKANRAMVKHRAHHYPKSRASRSTAALSGNFDSYGGVVWKNGTIYHDVEPTGQSQSGPFGMPTSTSDSLEGGVTSTTTTLPAN
ncbi:MAG TPA: hypothetical protein VIH30_02435 [Aquirhabdus sp.]